MSKEQLKEMIEKAGINLKHMEMEGEYPDPIRLHSVVVEYLEED